jgi:hypothetical protein
MAMGTKVAALCILGGFALLVPATAGSLERGYGVATSVVAADARARSDLTLRFAASLACNVCEGELRRCEAAPPYGNLRVCADRYYRCIKGKNCS